VDVIFFTDDTFFIRSNEEIKLFSREYKKKINLPFICCTDPLNFNETKLKLLLDAGLKRIKMGIETGSEEINRNLYNRFITNKKILTIAKTLNKYRNKMLLVEYQFIIANPYETEKDILATIDLLEKLPRPYYFQVFSLVFSPGTQLYYKAMNDGIIKFKKNTCYDVNYVNYGRNLMIKSKKLNTLYLNLLLTLMGGTVTSSRYKLLPRSLLKLLINKKIIFFFNKYTFLTKILIKISPANLGIKLSLVFKAYARNLWTLVRRWIASIIL